MYSSTSITHRTHLLDWVSYRVLQVRTVEDEVRRSWTLQRDDKVLAVFASGFGAEAEGRRLAHLECLEGRNIRLTVFNPDGTVDAEFTYTAPPCEGVRTQ